MLEFWTVVELQNNDGRRTANISTHEAREHALSKFYKTISEAVISKVPYHAAFLLSSASGQEMCEIYDRREPDLPPPPAPKEDQ